MIPLLCLPLVRNLLQQLLEKYVINDNWMSVIDNLVYLCLVRWPCHLNHCIIYLIHRIFARYYYWSSQHLYNTFKLFLESFVGSRRILKYAWEDSAEKERESPLGTTTAIDRRCCIVVHHQNSGCWQLVLHLVHLVLVL